jgi:hypothetical protein
VWAANYLRERTSSEAIRLGTYKQSEDFQSGWLAKGRESRQRMWRCHTVNVVLWANMANDG